MKGFRNQVATGGEFARGGLFRPARSVMAALGWALALAIVPTTELWARQSALDDLVFTVGTTWHNNGGQDWSYLLIGSQHAELLAGKRFAIYGKPGYATNSGTFTLRGTIFQQSNTAAITALLNQSVALGEDVSSVSNSLNVLLHNVPGISNQPTAQKILTAFQMSASDPSLDQSVSLLAQGHPGLKMSKGQGFAEQINAVTTYEVREVIAGTGASGDVLGRVTITPGAPVVLPAPGAPFQVVSNTSAEHLKIRLRWGTTDALRRLSLLNFGFNLWRIPRAAAETAGYQTTPPTLTQLYNDANFNLANFSPALASKTFSAGTGSGAADDPSDRTTTFFIDDHGVKFGLPSFGDGDQFYYFVTARDVLGRDGLASPGGLARACRKLAPLAPTGVKVANTVMNTNQQRLLVSWTQNLNPSNYVTEYWVYRWTQPGMALTNDTAPFSNRIAVVSQVAGTNNSFLDNTAGAPLIPGSNTLWYTVRAVSQAACAPLLSPQSAPAWGVLREHSGPPAASGAVQGSCGTPVVAFQSINTITNDDGFDPANLKYRFTCQRRDPGIAWVQFTMVDIYDQRTDTVAQIYFPPDGDLVQFDYNLTASGLNGTNDLYCVVGTFYGATSAPASAHYTVPVLPAQRQEATFLAGQLLETALSSADPLLAVLNGSQPYCLSSASAVADASGTVGLTFFANGGTPLLIRVLQTNTWLDLGVHTPDSNNVYWVSYPPCTLGPLPAFQGCGVNFPAGATGDCNQHITRGAADGAVAPLHIRFNLTPRTHEYRLYRSVDGGPLTLLGSGAAVFDPSNPAKQIARTDDAMPGSASRLCYYVQTLDEHGNGSPMAFLGCKDVKPAKLPRPVLAEPAAIGTSNAPQVSLNWFCPTGGVSRFQIKVERADQPGSGQPSGFGSSQLNKMLNYSVAARYAGITKPKYTRLTASLARTSLSHFDEAHLTPPISAGFGPGPQFTLPAGVVANVPYNISVAAVDALGNVGESSQVWKFTWVPPIVLANVPWPARPLPPVQGFDSDVNATPLLPYYPRLQPVFMTDPNFQLDYRFPVGIPIGYLDGAVSYTSNVRTTNYATFTVNSLGGPDPYSFLFHRWSSDSSKRNEPLLPIVIYREQVANALFPKVSGNVVQVSPLIERLPLSAVVCTDCTPNRTTYTILDRLLAVVWKFDQQNTYRVKVMICARDQQPVILGARYRYFVARFNDKREISEIIPAGDITIPTDPNANVPAVGVP